MIRAPATIPAIPGLQTALDGKLPLAGGTCTGIVQFNNAQSTGAASFRNSASNRVGYIQFFDIDTLELYFRENGSTFQLRVREFRVDNLSGLTEFRNASSAQTLRVYGTYASVGADYVRASLSSSGAAITLAAESAGTGSANLDLILTPKGTGKVGIGTTSPTQKLEVTGGILCTSFVSTGPVRLNGYTVAAGANQLPAGTQGDTAFVTDAAAPTFLSVVAGGGSVVTKVFFNGTSWICQ